MIKDELSRAILVANTINNEGTRVEMKVDAVIRALEQLLDRPGEPSVVPGVVPGAGFEYVFRGPGANDVVLQMYGIKHADEAQVLEDAAAVEAVLIGGDALQIAGQGTVSPAAAGGYADHASQAPSTSLYDVMPERSKLERMTVADLKALAERHGITLAEGTKGTIIDAMAGPKA